MCEIPDGGVAFLEFRPVGNVREHFADDPQKSSEHSRTIGTPDIRQEGPDLAISN